MDMVVRNFLVGMVLLMVWWSFRGNTEAHSQSTDRIWVVSGVVQDEDLHRVDQANVELRDQEGQLIESQISDNNGEFILGIPHPGIYSIRAFQSTLTSESVIMTVDVDPVTVVTLTLAQRQELTLEVVAPCLPFNINLPVKSYL